LNAFDSSVETPSCLAACVLNLSARPTLVGCQKNQQHQRLEGSGTRSFALFMSAFKSVKASAKAASVARACSSIARINPAASMSSQCRRLAGRRWSIHTPAVDVLKLADRFDCEPEEVKAG